MVWGSGYAGAQPGPPIDQDPFTAAERDTRAMVSAGWWPGAPPQQRQHAIAGRVLVLPDGTWWMFGAWARWYRWHPSDGQWHLCPPPQAPGTRMAARPVQQGMQAPMLPPHVVPAGPDFGFDAPPALPFVGHPVPAALTARVRATLESAATLPVSDYPHWWSLFSPGTPSTVAVSWGVMLWCAAAPVFDSHYDDQILGLWAPFRAKPLPVLDGPRWLTPPPLEALAGLYAERLRANRLDAAIVILRTIWQLASALREDARFQARADALLAIVGTTLNNPTADYEALAYGDQALVQHWLTRCPPHLVPALRNESSPGDNFRHAYYDLAQVLAKVAGDPAQPGYIEPRLLAAALIAADLGVARQDLVAGIVPWLDPEIRYTVQAVLSQGGHPLRRLWPGDAVLPDYLRAGLSTAEDREQLLGAMYGVDLAWCRLGGIPARPRGFPVPTAVTAEIIGVDRAKAAAPAAPPAPSVAPAPPVPPVSAGPPIQAGAASAPGYGPPSPPQAYGAPAGSPFGPQPGQPGRPGSQAVPGQQVPPGQQMPPGQEAPQGTPFAQPMAQPPPPGGPGAQPAPPGAYPPLGEGPGEGQGERGADVPGRPADSGAGAAKSRWTPGYEDGPAGPSATRLDGPSMGAPGPGHGAPGGSAGPVRTRLMGEGPGADLPGGPVPAPPGGPGVPPPPERPRTRIMSETMVAGFDFTGSAADGGPGEGAGNEGGADGGEPQGQVTEHFGVSYVSGRPDGGEDVPDIAAFLRELARTVAGAADGEGAPDGDGDEHDGAPSRDLDATSIDALGPRTDTANVLLVGSPHTGQRRMARIIALALADAGIGDGSVRTADAGDLRGAGAGRAVAVLGDTGPVLLFEGLDKALAEAEDPAALARAVRTLRSSPAAARTTLVATCEPAAYQRITEGHPGLADLFRPFRLPDLTDADNRLALLGVLAAERAVTVGESASDVVREDLDRLRGQGDLTNARLVEAYLDQACERHRGRAGAAAGRQVLAASDFEQVAEGLDPALRPIGDVEVFLRRIDGLAGLADAKPAIADLVERARDAAERLRYGVAADGAARRLVFLGPPGVGKTTVAGLLGGIYATFGLLGSGRVVTCRPVHLVGRDDGDTAHRVAAMVGRAAGGVLLVQEAHLLAEHPGVVAHLRGRTAERLGELLVICAGPVSATRDLLRSDEGFRADFGTVVEFDEPSDRELVLLFQRFAERDLYLLDEELRVELLARIGRMREGEGFAFARTMREIFERTVARQAARLAGASVDAATGARLTAADLPETALEQILGRFHEDQSG